MGQFPNLTYVVRQRVTVPRHLERYERWMNEEQIPLLSSRIPELAGVRRYREEKEELVFLTFYDFRPDVSWTPSTRAATRQIREAWYAFAPDMRDFSGRLYSRIWSDGEGPRGAAPHPIIVEYLTLLAHKEDEWNRWSEQLWVRELRDLPIADVQRYWALEGDPRFYLQIQEFEDEPTMRRKIKESEPATRPDYWSGWAEWMPYVENLGRYVFHPIVD